MVEEWWSQSAMGICAFLLYVQLIWCSGFPEIYAGLEECGGVCLSMVICEFFYM